MKLSITIFLRVQKSTNMGPPSEPQKNRFLISCMIRGDSRLLACSGRKILALERSRPRGTRKGNPLGNHGNEWKYSEISISCAFKPWCKAIMVIYFLSDKLKEMENSAIWAHSWRHFCLQELLPGQTTIDIHWYHWSLMPSSQKNPLHRTGIYDTMHMQHVLVIGVMIWEFLLPEVVWRNVPTAILAVCNSCWFLSFAVDLSLKVGEFHCKSQAHQPLYYLSMSIIFHLFPMISWCYYLLTSAYYILMLMPPAAKRLLGSGSSGSSDSSPLCSICWNCGWRMLKA